MAKEQVTEEKTNTTPVLEVKKEAPKDEVKKKEAPVPKDKTEKKLENTTEKK